VSQDEGGVAMITATDVASHPQEQPIPSSRRTRRVPIVVAILAVALGGTGLLMLQGGSNSDGTASGVSSSSDFLQAVSPTGIPRIRVWMNGHATSLQNGDAIAVADDLMLAVTIDPYPPTRFDVDVDLLLTAPDGTPVADAGLAVVWDMVIMGHGPFRTDFENAGAGHYRSHLNLFMFGPWDLDLEIDASYDLPDDLSVSLYIWPE